MPPQSPWALRPFRLGHALAPALFLGRIMAVSGMPGLISPLSPAAAPTPAQQQQQPAAAYPTTKTRIQTGTTTSATTMPFPLLGAPSKITVVETSTVTTYEPGPATAFPATVLETEVHTRHLTSYVAYVPDHAASTVSTGSTSVTYTLTRTWLVYPPDGAASGNRPVLPTAQALPCGECGAEPEQDARCKARGLRTACQRQCDLRRDDDGGDGRHLWCYRLEEWEYIYPELRMGRACWGDAGGNEFMQLNEPCLKGDYGVGCVPCRGRAVDWNGANWIDP